MKNREETLNPQPMFGDRETLMEAFDYAKMIVERGPKEETLMEAFDYAKMIVERGPKESYVYNITGLMVIWNTLAKNYKPLKRKK